MARYYAIGDIHGHLDALTAAHDLIALDRDRTGDFAAPVIHLGDLVDRGPDSAGVIETLRMGMAMGQPWRVLMGNHDELFLHFIDNPGDLAPPMLPPDIGWFNPRVGGRTTLASYGMKDTDTREVADLLAEMPSRIPQVHRDFLRALPSFEMGQGVFFCHAGIRPGVALDHQAGEDLRWIREPFLSDPRDHPALIVHGHTAIDRATHYGNRVNIDSGCGKGGALSAVVIENGTAWLLTDAGRQALPRG